MIQRTWPLNWNLNMLRRTYKGKTYNAVRAAAYYARTEATLWRDGRAWNYRNKGGLLDHEVLLPENAPAWMRNAEALWNSIERDSKRRDAQLARRLMVTFPHEMPLPLRVAVLRAFVQDHFIDAGLAAVIDHHEPHDDGDERNIHAHVMITLRPVRDDAPTHYNRDDYFSAPKVWGNTSRVFDRNHAKAWRLDWWRRLNRALLDADLPVAVTEGGRVPDFVVAAALKQAMATGDAEKVKAVEKILVPPQQPVYASMPLQAHHMAKRGLTTHAGKIREQTALQAHQIAQAVNVKLESLQPNNLRALAAHEAAIYKAHVPLAAFFVQETDLRITSIKPGSHFKNVIRQAAA